MIELRPYIDAAGRNPFERWFLTLNNEAKARVSITLRRLEEGNTSTLKSVQRGVYELKINFGPGYRVYCGKEGDTLVILLGGGTKKRQAADIATAQTLWQQYKAEKRDNEDAPR